MSIDSSTTVKSSLEIQACKVKMGVTLTDSNANCIVNHNHHNDYSKTNDDSWTHDVNQSNNNSLDFESCRDHQTKTDSNHSEDEEPLDPRIQVSSLKIT